MTVQIRNVHYTTLDRQATYTFDFEQQPSGEWRVYIVHQPSYNGRPSGTVETHRLTDGARRYVCWVPGPRTLDEAKGVARAWADATHEYIRTGRFPPPGPERYVPDLSTSADWAFRAHVGAIPQEQAPPPRPPRPTVVGNRRRGLRNIFPNVRNLP